MADHTLFGKNLKRMLQEKNMTSKELADKSFVNANTLTRYFKGETNPSVEVAQNIADVLGVQIWEFFEPIKE